MSVKEFLLARIARDEERAECMLDCLDKDRKLRECEAKRAIIKQHEEWPLQVKESVAPTFEANCGVETITLRMSQRLIWLTEREYIKRFGVEPPTAPMILALAAIYSDHPDYQPEWAANQAEGAIA